MRPAERASPEIECREVILQDFMVSCQIKKPEKTRKAGRKPDSHPAVNREFAAVREEGQ
jgi:hypothetical protein